MFKKEFLIIILILTMFFSCTDDLFKELGTLNSIPDKETKPVIKHFVLEDAIVIEWEKDEAADEYILYKDEDPFGTFSNKIYQGNDLQYFDRDVVTEIFYYYKLAKRKDNKIFNKSGYSAGVASSTRRDGYEINESRGKSTWLDNKTYANIYFYRDQYGNIIEDVDWFKITVNPKQYVKLVINNMVNYNGYELLKVVDLESESDVDDSTSFNLTNGSYVPQTHYLKIFPDRSDYLEIPSASGGKFISYVINFVEIQDIED